MKRRQFISNLSLGAGLGLVPGAAALAAAARPDQVDVQPVQAMMPAGSRTWLGENFWANRLQDWRLQRGRLECLRNEAQFEVRTVAVLTLEMVAGSSAGRSARRISSGVGTPCARAMRRTIALS